MTEEEALLFSSGYPVQQRHQTASRTEDVSFKGLYRNPIAKQTYMQLDVFHSLHCLNYIRKNLHADYYEQHPTHIDDPMTRIPPSWPKVHLEHCLDHIRQSIQCFGDLSPGPFFEWRGLDLTIATGQLHTCRDLEQISKWQDERNENMPFMEDVD
jgi:hypothetical protein